MDGFVVYPFFFLTYSIIENDFLQNLISFLNVLKNTNRKEFITDTLSSEFQIFLLGKRTK